MDDGIIKNNILGTKKNHKSFKELTVDALRFAFSKPSSLLFLGIFLLMIELVDEFFDEIINFSSFILIILVIAIILSIYESGYSFMIFKHSIDGANKPPSIFNYKEIFHHGIKDFLVMLFYSIILIVIQVFIAYYVNKITNDFIAILLSNINSFIGGFFIMILNIALINLAINNGNFKSAFNFKEIKTIFQSVGLLRIIVIWFILDFFNFLFIHLLSFNGANNIFIILNLVVLFIFTPASLLFSKRFLIMATTH